MNIFENKKEVWGYQLLSLMFYLSIGIVLFFIFSSSLIPLFSHYTLGSLQKAETYSDPEYLRGLTVMQICYHLFVFILPPLIFYKVFNSDRTRYLGKSPIKGIHYYLYAIGWLLASCGLISLTADLNKMIPLPQSWKDTEAMATEITQAILNIRTWPQYFLTIFFIGLLPAIGEELLFRGCLQQLIHKPVKNMHLAIWITAILFGVMHGQMESVLPRIFLGGLLGYLFYYTGSLWPSIIAHFFNNSLMVTLSFIEKRFNVDTVADIQDELPGNVIIFTTIIFIIITYHIYKLRKQWNG